ncbi:phosphopyruvate hydratase [Candidatus Curtissbacteria bacterium RIFCSPLOWO2_01_FULL_41_18]|uniref:Enolase n=1 Tax=Candidatus Curtissbacteria bacterium RIFCSPLOWO2_01_FULL_41_18 TaxID=1797727 RepID=A0A1F5HMW7_9BACT|nr:MAG: phosphopyruvate hydratase [Candidatus Curtissbacteria bacterium RIFCSPLOWO2_01_FULL_41_18]
MAKIRKLVAREILDSRGFPTVEVMVQLEDSSVGVFSTPTGISVGKHEAVELRDGDVKRYEGRGVLTALKNILTFLAPKVIGKDSKDQKSIDKEMVEIDGTENKSKLGANGILAVSGAIAKAQAVSENLPLYAYVARLAGRKDKEPFSIPTQMFNILNGGKHGGGNIDFQEFMVVPPQANSYSQNLKMGVEIYYALKDVIISHSGVTLVGDEGGFAPVLYSNSDAFKILEEAVNKAGYNLGLTTFFSIDAAASYLKDGNAYRIKDRPVALSGPEFIEYYAALNEQFHLLSIEDPLSEDAWDDWQTLTEKMGNETLIVGDDLITTNLDRLNKAISKKACNAVIIKPNQAGTISETLEVVNLAKSSGLKIIVSHRSGETNDDFIADFAVGINAEYAKLGAPARGERVAKYNRLLEIEHEIS